MNWPLSQDYNEAIQSPGTSFSDPELQAGQVVVNALGLPVPCSGNFAGVYQFVCPQTRWAVKCFTRQVRGLRERYAEISRYLEAARLPFTEDFQYLEQGIRIRGAWYPILKMHWVEGMLLNVFVRENLDKPSRLEALSEVWRRMAKRLREAKLAHADLQHGNVILVPGSTANSLAIKLIDYDGMFVPALAGKTSGEVGHPNYQHPLRLKDGTYNVEVDRFPLLVVATALRALSVSGRQVWERYDNGDNLLFREQDLRDPRESRLIWELVRLNDPKVKRLVDCLSRAAYKPLDQTPLLEDLVPNGPGLPPLPAADRKEDPKTTSTRAAVARSDGSTVLGLPSLLSIATAIPGTLPDGSRTRQRKKLRRRDVIWGMAAGGMAILGLMMGLVAWATWPAGSKTRQDAALVKSVQKAKSPPKQSEDRSRPREKEDLKREFTNSIGIKLILIPGGFFRMGSSQTMQDEAIAEHERIAGSKGSDHVRSIHRSEGPQHLVEVSPFHFGVYEVTQKQFRSVMGYNPSYFSKKAKGKQGVTYRMKPGGGANRIPRGEDTEDYPVENVTWEEATEFSEKLTTTDSKKPAAWKYRLPTEAEWEYACRAGVDSQGFHFGNSLSTDQANFGGNLIDSKTDEFNPLNRSCPVGRYEKNAFGLHDMHGNVWEWCHDWYAADYYLKSASKDPPGSASGSVRVFRGGGWESNSSDCRSAYRNGHSPPGRPECCGFRVALVPLGKKPEGKAREEPQSDEASAVAKLEKLGARIQRDNRLSGNPVVTVFLNSPKATDTTLKELAAFKRLQTLWLRGSKVTDTGLKELTTFNGLQTLILESTQVTDVGLKELASLKGLQSLYLTSTRVTDVGLKELAVLNGLQTLELSFTRVTDVGLKELVALKGLQSLYLGNTKVTDVGLKELAALEGLQTLVLYHTNVTDAGLKELIGLKRLQLLSLVDTKVTDAGLKVLAALKGLQSLNLGNTKVTDAGLKELSVLKELWFLSLTNTEVTDAGLKELVVLRGLRFVIVNGTRVTDAGVTELKKSLPICQIVR